jgi:hypothetical protein
MIILKTPFPFDQFSSAPPDSPQRLLSSSKSSSAVSPHSRLCTQQIGNKILIVLAILRICIIIEKWSVGMRRLYIHTQGWHTFYFITLMSFTVTLGRTWRSGWRRGSGRRFRQFLVEVRRFLCTSSVSADSWLCHFGIEGSHLFDF